MSKFIASECGHGIELIFDGIECVQRCDKCKENAMLVHFLKDDVRRRSGLPHKEHKEVKLDVTGCDLRGV